MFQLLFRSRKKRPSLNISPRVDSKLVASVENKKIISKRVENSAEDAAKKNQIWQQARIFFVDHWHLLVKSAAENHLRIQRYKIAPQEGEVCNLNFGSYSELRKYQKRVRLFTYSFSSTLASVLAVVLLGQFFFWHTSHGATYTWNQGKWDSVSSAATDVHNISEGGSTSFTSWQSKSASLQINSPAPLDSNLTIATSSPAVVQSDDSTASTGFKLSGYNNSQTAISGAGSAASVKLDYQPNFYNVSFGQYNKCAVKGDGSVYCWGQSSFYLNGNGLNDGSQQLTPYKVNITNAKQVEVGANFACVLKKDGTVWCWGAGNSGQLGNNGIADQSAPVQVAGVGGSGLLSGVSAISTGPSFACALLSSGSAVCWGRNYFGQLGDGTTTDRSYPVAVPGLANIASLKTGMGTSCALKNDATLWCWGLQSGTDVYSGYVNQLTPTQAAGNLASNVASFALGYDNNDSTILCGIKTTGEVYCAGHTVGNGVASPTSTTVPQRVVGVGNTGWLGNVSQLSISRTSSFTEPKVCALDNNKNDVYCWGNTTNFNSWVNYPMAVANFATQGGVTALAAGSAISTATNSYDSNICIIANDANKSVYCKGEIPGDSTASSAGFVQVKGEGGVGTLALSVPQFYSSGTYTSGVIDTGQKTLAWGNVSWNATLNTQTLTIKARSAATADFAGAPAWTACTNLTSGQPLASGGCVTNGQRYIQYQAVFATTNVLQSPSLDDITLNYSYYPTGQTLVSAPFDSGSAANAIGALAWKESVSMPVGAGLTFSVRTADTQANLATSLWSDFTNGGSCSKDGTGLVSCPASSVPASLRDAVGDQWFQYKVTLNSAGDTTPMFDEARVNYVVNAPPEVNITSATQGADGKVTINFNVRDADGTTDLFDGIPSNVNISALEYCTLADQSCTTSGWASAVSYTGDTSNITVSETAWTSKQIVWTPKTDFNGNYFANFKLRLKADDMETANRYGYGTSAPFELDTKDPTNVSMVVNHSNNNLILTTPTENTTYTMALAKTSDFSAATDMTFASPYTYSSIAGDSDPTTVFVRIKDAKGNFTIAQATTPSMPANLAFYDLSNVASGDYREFISWTTIPANQAGSGFAAYEIYRSDGDQLHYVKIKTEPSRLNNFFLDTGLTPSVHYYYRVDAIDTNGDISKFSNVVDDVPNGQGLTDQTPPVISGVTVSAVTTTSAKVTWNTDELADSSVAYSTDVSYLPERAVSSVSLAHEIVLTGLTPGTTYNVRVKSRDIAGNLGQNDKDNPGSSPAINFTFTTTPGPAISNVAIPSVSNNQATITWNTTLNANTHVVYSDTVSSGVLVAATDVGSNDMVGGSAPFGHSWTLTGLVSGKTYYFYVKSTDAANNVAIDDNGGQFYSFATTVDLTPPVITSYVGNPLVLTDTQTAVGFSTSKKAKSRLGYKKTGDLAFTYTPWNDNYNTEHVFVLTTLSKETGYAYYIEAQDINGNNANSPQSNLTTLQTQVAHPALINPAPASEISISDTKAVISLETNTDSVAKLCYAKTTISDTNYATCLSGNVSDSLHLVDSGLTAAEHVFQLGAGLVGSDNPALEPNTQYHYRIQAIDSQNNTLKFLTLDKTFTTKKIQVDQHDSLASISTPGAGDITASTDFAFISWSTDQLANSDLACATKSGGPYNEFLSSDLVDYGKFHTLKITGLPAGSKVYCKVTSTDDLSPATTKVSNEFSFTTNVSAEFNHAPLTKISFNDPNPSVLTDTDAVVSFSTDQAANCYLEYGSASGNYGGVPLKETADIFNKGHALHLMGLIFQTKYFYKVTCQDNLKTVISSDEQTFTTKDKMLTGSQWGASNGADIVPPTISNIKVASVTGESATITWDTDEKSSSSVRYGVDSNYGNTAGNDLVNSSKDKYVTAHTVTIPGLVPATKYFFLVSSLDGAGNIAESAQVDFTTAAPSSISSIKAVSLNLGEATVTWNTDQETTSTVEYGLTTSYGEKKENNSFTKDHSISLSSLNQGSVYHYRVKGKDRNGQLYASADQTFEPKSPPQVSNVSVNEINEHEAKISFDTNVPTTAMVLYTDVQDQNNNGAQVDSGLATSHSVQLKNLSQGTTFAVNIKITDEQGTESEGKGKDFTTGKDETPPKIDQVRTESALTQSDKVQTIITWKTDEQSTTALIYKETRTGEEKEIKVTDNLTTGHVAVITSFKPGSVYYFKAKSVDASGNEAQSGEFALLTPRRKENIIQIIINNFQDIFGWARR